MDQKPEVRQSIAALNTTENEGTVDDNIRTSMVLRDSNNFQAGLKNETQINASQTASNERNEEEKQPQHSKSEDIVIKITRSNSRAVEAISKNTFEQQSLNQLQIIGPSDQALLTTMQN